jgi:predicted dehydrogenase
MVGFNRRFSPLAAALRHALALRPGPRRFSITVNAGRLDRDHWTLDPRVGGGRIVGEACHFVDLVRFLEGTPIQEVCCLRRDTDGQDGGAFELAFAGGASALIDYRTDLAPHLPKEIIEVRGDGYSARIHNWARLTSSGLGGLRLGAFWSRAPRKGHPEALAAFMQAVQGAAAPITPGEILEVSRWSIAMQAMRADN